MRWQIGQDVLFPWYEVSGRAGGWERGTIVALRGDKVVIDSHGHEYERDKFTVRRILDEWEYEGQYYYKAEDKPLISREPKLRKQEKWNG